MRVYVRLEGLEEVKARLNRVSGTRLVGVLQRGLNRAAREVATAAKQRAPYKSGDLRRAIFWESSADPSEAAAAVIVPPINGVPYGLFQHEGTGIHGPTGQPIRPVHAEALRFETTFGAGFARISKSGKTKRRAASHTQYAKQVKGVAPNPFLMDAYESARAIGLVQKELAVSFNQAVRGGELSFEVEGGGADAD